MSRPCVVGPAPLTPPSRPLTPRAVSSRFPLRKGNHDSAGASPQPATRPARRPPWKPEPRTRHTSRDNSACVQSLCTFCGICSAGKEKATLETSRTFSQCACGWRLPSIGSGLSRALRRGPRASREAVPAQQAHWAQVPAGSDLRSGAHPSKTSTAKIPEEALLVRAPGLRALGRAPHAPHSITRALADFNRRASHPWLKGTEPMGPWIQVAD